MKLLIIVTLLSFPYLANAQNADGCTTSGSNCTCQSSTSSGKCTGTDDKLVCDCSAQKPQNEVKYDNGGFD